MSPDQYLLSIEHERQQRGDDFHVAALRLKWCLTVPADRYQEILRERIERRRGERS